MQILFPVNVASIVVLHKDRRAFSEWRKCSGKMKELLISYDFRAFLQKSELPRGAPTISAE